ncbi:hypothetical protein ABIC16_000668 [Sphingomonas sp. PvP055]|uniref:ATP-binding protein n=1 Tax=Sphingomonas sp. PvP055 TaxID=3156391 RepID=UPI003392F2B6
MSELESDEFLFSLAGRVRNLGFSPSPINALFPLFEAIANAFHAVEARFGREAPKLGRISVKVIRSDSEDENPPIQGFVVEDNGIGLNADNWRAFRTADTSSKIERGGKGVGRLSWLKVFENTIVSSVFSSDDIVFSRTFEFRVSDDTAGPVINHAVRNAGELGQIGTRIHLEPFAPDYIAHCPRKIETIASHIVGHFLKNFVSYEVPLFTLGDRDNHIKLLEFFSENIVSEKHVELDAALSGGLEPVSVDVYHILIKKALKFHDSGKHWLVFVGDGRVVRQQKVDNQLGLGFVGDNQDCIYVGLVSGPYLDQHVNQERTRFTFPDENFKMLHTAALNSAKEHLSDYISAVRAKQAETTLDVIKENPQFLSVTRDVNKFVNEHLSLNAQDDEEIFLELSRQRRRQRRETKRDIRDLATGPSESLAERVQKIADAINADKKGSLAEYVVKRKEILDLLDKSISYADPEKRDYLREEIVHDIIIPIRSDSEALEYEDHNLWLLDDRLAFYSYFKSDKPFKTFLTESDSGKEADVAVVFDRSLAFDREGTDEPVVIIEFKRPGRKAYAPGDDPVKQVLDYVKIFRKGGNFVDRTGKVRKPIPVSTRFICFVVADFTDNLVDILETSIAQHRSTDGEGFFGFSSPHNAYVEVIPYSKMLHDARLRNEAFFAKLGLL